MKTIEVLVMISFLVFVLSANQLLAAHDAVLDNEGKAVIAGEEYYILPPNIMPGKGGGLTTGVNINGALCPLSVIQEPSDVERGRPVIFTPWNTPEDKAVQTQTKLNIVFSGPLYCRARYFMWKLGEFDQTLGRFCVTTEPLLENPGPNTLINWFKIEKETGTLDIDYNYKIVYCSSVCETSCEVQCRDLGIFFDRNGVRRLCLNDVSDVPFPFSFANANVNPITTSSY